LFLWAGKTKHFPAPHARKLAARLKNARVEEIPEAEHWMALDRDEEVAARIGSFLGPRT